MLPHTQVGPAPDGASRALHYRPDVRYLIWSLDTCSRRLTVPYDSLAPTMVCRTCGERRPVTEFDTRSDTGRQHRLCKPCRRAYQRSRWRSRKPVVSRPRRLAGSGDLFTCTRCHRSLPADAFPRKLKGSSLLQSWCRSCFAANNSERYHAGPERPKARARRNRELRSSALRHRQAAG